jgi:hypothetical protein
LFAAIVCGSARRWGKVKTAWLIPIVWTGIEYFRSELYFLKFSWMNIGYAFPFPLLGMYGVGFILLAIAAAYFVNRWLTVTVWLFTIIFIAAMFLPALASSKSKLPKPVTFVGVQMEFPPQNVIPQILKQALAKNTNAAIFVLSEYSLDGGVPDSLKNWCRDNSRFLVFQFAPCRTNTS